MGEGELRMNSKRIGMNKRRFEHLIF